MSTALSVSTTQPIFKQSIADSFRNNFLDSKLDDKTQTLTSTLYRQARSYSGDYAGEHWGVFGLTNGGFYLAPVVFLPKMHVEIIGQFAGDVTPDAFGILTTLRALTWLIDKHERDALIDCLFALRAYAWRHAEAHKIRAAVE